MALYRYVKAKPRVFPKKSAVSAVLSLAGLIIIGWVAYPIVSFELISNFKYKEIIKPVAEQEEVYARENKDIEVLGAQKDTAVDYTKASNWFPQKPQASVSQRDYFLSIPKLKIKDAQVLIGGEDLNKSLIHYGGTGLPGDFGSAVIFGHSILPQFYNPKNYKAIFSLLPKLERGDEIFLDFDGMTLRYVVINMWVTDPSDISVLEQRYDASYLTLVTCVPPGTYWKRLVISARLEKI